MKKTFTLILMAMLLVAYGNLSAQILYYDFEQCNVGDKAAETLGEPWTTWNQAPGSAEDAAVSDEHSQGTRALKIDSGNDVVLKLGDKTTGVYNISFDMYIPEGKEGYFNILHEFAGTNSVWAYQMWFNSDEYGNHTWPYSNINPSFSFPFDEWFNITIDVFLDDALACAKINNELIGVWLFSSETTRSKQCHMSAMNFYAPSSDSSRNGFFIDNISFNEKEGPFVHELIAENESVEIVIEPNKHDTVISTLTNIGHTIIGNFDCWIDYGVGTDGGENKTLHYDLQPYYNYGYYSSNTYVEVGVQFLKESPMLSSMTGMKITKMQYYVPYSNGTYGCEGPMTFRIYKGFYDYYDNGLLAEKTLETYTLGAWNTVEFDHPIPLRGYDIFATVGFQQIDGGYPISLDAGPSSNSFADLVRLNHEDWFSLNENSLYYGGSEWGNLNIRLICEGQPVEASWVKKCPPLIPSYLIYNQSGDFGLAFNSDSLDFGMYEAVMIFETVFTGENVELSIPIKMKVSGANVEEIIDGQYKIYPNPTNGTLKIEAEDLQSISISNMLGQHIYEALVNGDRFEIDFSDHEAGVYLIRIETAKGVATKRVVVTR